MWISSLLLSVSQPCHIGCSGLSFCTNFNHRSVHCVVLDKKEVTPNSMPYFALCSPKSIARGDKCHLHFHDLRHTELFRSCTKVKDKAAKSDYENWLDKKRVEIHSMDVVPVKEISTCLPEMWKVRIMRIWIGQYSLLLWGDFKYYLMRNDVTRT